MAYCLLGIFNAHMPLLYGEGARAFTRLQEVILARSEDYTAFLWTQICDRHDSPSSSAVSSSPMQFSRRGFQDEYMYRDSYKVWLTVVTYSKYSDIRIFNPEIPNEDDSLMENILKMMVKTRSESGSKRPWKGIARSDALLVTSRRIKMIPPYQRRRFRPRCVAEVHHSQRRTGFGS
jgi:hypothetical protein